MRTSISYNTRIAAKTAWPSHFFAGGPGVHHSVGKLLPLLAEKAGLDALHLVHRLDKETTGVMLLAK